MTLGVKGLNCERKVKPFEKIFQTLLKHKDVEVMSSQN